MPVHATVRTLGFSTVPHVTSVAGTGASNALPFQNCLDRINHLFFFSDILIIAPEKTFFNIFLQIFIRKKIYIPVAFSDKILHVRIV